jgi:hypothetical protein
MSEFVAASSTVRCKVANVMGADNHPPWCVAQDPRRPATRLHDSTNFGSYLAAPHSHSQLMWGPQEHGMVATIMCPGSSQ